MAVLEIDLTVYPDECDAFGHLNQASFLSLFERARWEMLARGPGMDVFTVQGAWPAVRKTAIDYHAPAFPGDVLRFHQALTHHGRTSFTMRQTARRVGDDRLIATAEFVFVCIDRGGRPTPVPGELGRFLTTHPSEPPGVQRMTVNGVSLAVEVRGTGPAVLLIHGYPLDRTLWAPQLAGVEGHRLIAPDLRGLGLSDAPDLGYSMPTYADDLAALLEALQVDEVVLVGLSMGGYVAFEFLRRHRARVRALVLFDTRADADQPEVRRARDQQASLAREQGAAAIAAHLLPRMLAPGAAQSMPHVVERVRGMMLAAPVAGIAGALAAMRDRSDSTALLATLDDLPTMIVVGEEDAMTPVELARAMASVVPGARLEVVPDAGHLPPLEAPAAVNALLADFLKSLPALP
jgi:YbgC/YbaW family acyl-CoA thioester hydrolase